MTKGIYYGEIFQLCVKELNQNVTLSAIVAKEQAIKVEQIRLGMTAVSDT